MTGHFRTLARTGRGTGRFCVESKPNMAIPPRRWVGYALLIAGLSLLFDTLTFLQTNWSPLKVPMYAANELAIGCLLTVAAALVLLAPTLKRTLLRIRIGIALILIAAAIYGGWEWWMATRTWVPLDMPVSLAQGHIRSPEFKINLYASFWIFVEVETKVDGEGVSCLTGYTFDYCRKNGVRELRASWTLSDRGRVVARGSTDNYQGSRGGMVTKARYLGNFSVPSGDHLVLDVEFPEDNSHFNGGHPRLTIAQSYYWRFEENRTPVFLFAMFFGAIGTALLVSGIVESTIARRTQQRVSLTSQGPIAGGFQWEAEPTNERSNPERRQLLRARALIGLGLATLGMASLVIVKRWIDTRIFMPADIPVSLAAGHIRTGPFRINVEQGYSIWIDFDQSTYFNPMCSSYSALKTTWTLYREGRVYAQWDAPVLQDGYLEGFDAKNGIYDLDIDVLADASCLNANRPRLKIVTSRDNDSFYAGVLLWSSATSIVVGISLVILGWRGGIFTDLEPSAIVTNAPSVGQNFQWAQKLPARRPIVGMPAFGLLAGTVFAILAILMMMLTGAFQYKSKGLWVHPLKPGAAPSKPDAWTEPVIVLVKDAGPGQEPGLYVNSKVVAWDDLAGALRHELSGRREWAVYVEGDDCVVWANVANVIDIAHTDGAKVFLLPQPDRKPCKEYVGTNSSRKASSHRGPGCPPLPSGSPSCADPWPRLCCAGGTLWRPRRCTYQLFVLAATLS
jgi:biopolymer transport protein ExbD